MSKYIASVDQGTTSTRCVAVDCNGQVVFQTSLKISSHHPRPGWVEQDANDIWTTSRDCLKTCIDQLGPDNITGVGLTNQRETTIAWSRSTGEALHPAIVWMDTRTTELVKEFQKQDDQILTSISNKTGLFLSTYFSALKMTWLLRNVPAVIKAREQGDLCFGTVDSWLMFKFLGSHVTDITNASRTMLMDLDSGDWDEECCRFFGIPKESLPKIKSNAQVMGSINLTGVPLVPLAGCLGDQQAALLGHKCFEPGQTKLTFGTGCFLLCNTGNKVKSRNGLLTTVAFQLGPKAPRLYALEGSVAIAGAMITWMRDQVKLVEDVHEFNEMANCDSQGVYFVPAFSGLFAPHWREDAKGTIVGLTLKSDKRHIVRAAMEAICYQNREVLEAMELDGQKHISKVNVDGGLSNSDICMQFQADITNKIIERSSSVALREATAIGAAFACGLALGTWKSVDEIKALKLPLVPLNPRMTEKEREFRFLWWKKAVTKSHDWPFMEEYKKTFGE